MNQWATEANQKYRAVLNLERVGPLSGGTILKKREREGNIEVGRGKRTVLCDTCRIQRRAPLPPQQNISVVRRYKTRQQTKHLPPSRENYRWWTI